jgi:hypothetical protein
LPKPSNCQECHSSEGIYASLNSSVFLKPNSLKDLDLTNFDKDMICSMNYLDEAFKVGGTKFIT